MIALEVLQGRVLHHILGRHILHPRIRLDCRQRPAHNLPEREQRARGYYTASEAAASELEGGMPWRLAVQEKEREICAEVRGGRHPRPMVACKEGQVAGGGLVSTRAKSPVIKHVWHTRMGKDSRQNKPFKECHTLFCKRGGNRGRSWGGRKNGSILIKLPTHTVRHGGFFETLQRRTMSPFLVQHGGFGQEVVEYQARRFSILRILFVWLLWLPPENKKALSWYLTIRGQYMYSSLLQVCTGRTLY